MCRARPWQFFSSCLTRPNLLTAHTKQALFPALQAATGEGSSTEEDARRRGNSTAAAAAAAPPPPPQPLWSAALLSLVAGGLELELSRPGGLAGCCVPGMWCGPRGCYTLAYGNTFSNFGGYVGMPADEYRWGEGGGLGWGVFVRDFFFLPQP